MNEKFYDKIKSDYEATGNPTDFQESYKICGPWPQKVKGWKERVKIYKYIYG